MLFPNWFEIGLEVAQLSLPIVVLAWLPRLCVATGALEADQI